MIKPLLILLFSIVLASFFQTSYSQNINPENVVSLIFVQTTHRNSDGQLITYLESSKFTDINIPILNKFLDFEASQGNDPIISINEKDYQVIRRTQTVTFDSENVIASTLLHDKVDGKLTLLARFAHDGYPVISGDTMESVWTFTRPLN